MEMIHIWVKNAADLSENAGNQTDSCKTVSSLREARDIVRTLLAGGAAGEITVHLTPGLYDPTDFVFGEEDCSPDCTVIYAGEEGAILHGGLTIPKEKWQMPDEAMAARFDASVREKVCMADLTEYGFSDADWGEMQTIGSFCTADKYTDVPGGSRCEAFCGDRRMTIARYPNEGYLQLDAVADVGDCREFPAQNYYLDWDDRKDHRGGTYIIDRQTNAHISRWADPSTAWVFGYFMWDWADSSTPITIDTVNRRIFPKYVSRFGAVKGADYYLYNVPEELDTVCEWYLDRKTGKMYFYPAEDAETIDFYCHEKPLIVCRKTCNMQFRNLTLRCTMGNGIECLGKNMVFSGLLVKNIAGNAMQVAGCDNLVENCEVTHTGKGGIYLSGGDRQTLTPGSNRVTNCFIHDFSEVYQTYQPGVQLNGVGNTCDHCEICRSPHAAVMYGGNEHLIEYNYIHDMVLMSSDAGAIYSGYDWAGNGTVVRYNRLERIGANGFQPDGIYWDDGLSGQTAYGNLLIGIGKNGFLAGGGRENTICGNIIIDCRYPIQYDDRNRDGFVHDGWARSAVNTPGKGHWQRLKAVPYDSGIWKEKYPRLSKIQFDFEKYDDPDFPINPTYSTVSGNVIIDRNGNLGLIAQSVYDYSTMEN
ncbi:MAG: right-handed parallel beta-helix repeat-containing protein, partial [Clostridia bacterium]|nr:right-handed parallel beta-helix repeat-containing protein [Clostridia bacterium]